MNSPCIPPTLNQFHLFHHQQNCDSIYNIAITSLIFLPLVVTDAAAEDVTAVIDPKVTTF